MTMKWDLEDHRKGKLEDKSSKLKPILQSFRSTNIELEKSVEYVVDKIKNYYFRGE